jgi:hypothetical protein
MATNKYSQIEEEVIFLRTITDLIDSMVNFSMLSVLSSSPEAGVLFHTAAHQKLFNILLVDLLSVCDRRLMGRQTSYLDALREMCNQPCFDVDGSVASLRVPVNIFSDWLSHEPTVDAWLPSVNHEVQLTLPRSTFIRMCGNLSKHSILRQSRPAEELRGLLEQTGLSLEDCVLALEDFYERFHNDIFNYHASQIAQMLNEIQWGVYEYLQPEYRRSYVYDGGELRQYHFRYPNGVVSNLAKSLYWDLMNWIRRKPIIERFTVSKYLKMRY